MINHLKRKKVREEKEEKKRVGRFAFDSNLQEIKLYITDNNGNSYIVILQHFIGNTNRAREHNSWWWTLWLTDITLICHFFRICCQIVNFIVSLSYQVYFTIFLLM